MKNLKTNLKITVKNKLKFNFNNLQEKKFLWFVIYALLSTMLIYIINDIIITDPKYYTGGNDNSAELFRNIYKVIYFIYPLYLFLKITITAFFLKLGCSFFKAEKIKFANLFLLVLVSEFVFLIVDFSEVIWFLFIHTNYTMEEVSNYSFLSLFSLLNHDNISSAYSYSIKLINIFEIFYWVLLVIGIKEITGKTNKQSFKIVASSYGVMLLFIIVFRYILFSFIL